MKKLILIAASLASMFLAGSCQRENLEPAATDKSVTFNVEAPAAMQTKAIADGLNVDELIYEVYLTEDKEQKDLADAVKLYQGKVEMTKVEARYASSGYINTAEVTVELLQDQHYTVLFWAQVAGTGAYNTTNLTEVKYNKAYGENDTQYNANDESLAAFYAVEHITDGDPAVKDVTLRRPFAQLNLGTTNAKANSDGTYTIALDQSKVKVENVPTAFNVATSAVSVPATMYFKMSDVPAKSSDEADRTLTVNDKPYQYAGMNYLFASKDNTVTVTYDIQANLTTKDGVVEAATVNNTVTNVPLKENHRTNIIGNLLTSQTEYEVVVDAKFEEPAEVIAVWDGSSVTEPAVETDTNTGEQVYVVDEASDLAWLAQMVNGPLTRATTVESYDVKLEADIDLGNYPWTPIGYNPNEEAGNEMYFTGTFDGKGHTIKNLYIDVKDKGGVGFFGAVHNATIKNVTFENVFVKAVESEDDPANTSGAEGKKKYIVGGHMGAVAGYDANAGEITFDNVHVKGLVKIEGETRAAQGQRIGGIIGGRGSSNIIFNNVSVKGTEGSYIKGYCSTAGVSGQIQGVATYDNVHTDIDVYAVTFGAGGIAGIVRHGSTFNNCSSVGDITLDASRTQLSSYSANYPYRVGGIAGCWSESKTGVLELTSCSYTGTLTSIDKDGNSPEAFDYAGYVGRGYSLNGCAGSKVSINGVEYVQVYDEAADAGLYYVNGEYTVASAANLKVFAAKVNDGDTFEGKTIYLVNDIDLKNEQWIPIGYWETFDGTFDGNNHTVSNLKHHGTEADCYVGLFGYTNNATIKNLTINNVDIKLVADNSWAGGHMGALVGNAEGKTVIENITVTGDVKIDGDLTKAGAGRIGGVVGGNTCTGTIKNVVVNANAGSFVKGNSSVGGIAGQLQPSATGGELTFVNCASNIDVTAQEFCAGGIIGLAAYSTSFEDCSTSGNISVLAGRSGNANDLYRVGGIAGGWDDGADKVLSLVNCSTTCVLSGQSADGKTASGFDCGGFVGRGYSAVVGAKVVVNGTEYIYAGDGKYADANGFVMIAPGLGQKEKTYAVSSAEGLVAMSNIVIKGGESVILTADIDLTGVEFNGLNAFNPESNNTFDGQRHTVSNWTYTGGAADMAFIKNWVGTIKNVTIESASLKTAGRSAVLAAKVYANIENCHVVDSRIEDSYWACGVIAGLYNSGNITNCSVDGCYVQSNGGVGGIVGVINETAGKRNIEGCAVKNTTVNNTGVYGEGYSGALVAGMLNVANATINFNSCTLETNTKEGKYVGDLFYSAEGNSVFVDGVQQ